MKEIKKRLQGFGW